MPSRISWVLIASAVLVWRHGIGRSRYSWPSAPAPWIARKYAKPWDRKLVSLLGLFSMLIPAVGWRGPSLLNRTECFIFNIKDRVKISAFAILKLLANVLGSWALIANRYFSGVVRIQTDSGSRWLKSAGQSYRWVRHPEATPAPCWFIKSDALFSGFVVGISACGFDDGCYLVYRTSLEDNHPARGTGGVPRVCCAGALPFAAGGVVNRFVRKNMKTRSCQY